jgi:hypothetical protein
VVGVLLGALSLAACGSDACQTASPLLFVDIPGGTDSLASFAATGSCAPAVGGCEPLSASCQTAACPCRFTVQVNPATFDASSDGTCHIKVVEKSGLSFAKDLAFTSNGGACFSVSGPKGIVVLDALPDGGPIPSPVDGDAGGGGGAGGSDADAHETDTGADGGAADAPDAG